MAKDRHASNRPTSNGSVKESIELNPILFDVNESHDTEPENGFVKWAEWSKCAPIKFTWQGLFAVVSFFVVSNIWAAVGAIVEKDPRYTVDYDITAPLVLLVLLFGNMYFFFFAVLSSVAAFVAHAAVPLNGALLALSEVSIAFVLWLCVLALPKALQLRNRALHSLPDVIKAIIFLFVTSALCSLAAVGLRFTVEQVNGDTFAKRFFLEWMSQIIAASIVFPLGAHLVIPNVISGIEYLRSKRISSNSYLSILKMTILEKIKAKKGTTIVWKLFMVILAISIIYVCANVTFIWAFFNRSPLYVMTLPVVMAGLQFSFPGSILSSGLINVWSLIVFATTGDTKLLLEFLQLFLVINSTFGLLAGAVKLDHDVASNLLKAQSDRLEALVELRTKQLSEQNEQLVISRDEADRLNRVKSEFLARMSHEIRTPLNGIVGMVDLLPTADDPSTLETVQTIRSSAHILLSLVNDILDLSKIESSMMELETRSFSFHMVCERAIDVVVHNPVFQEDGSQQSNNPVLLSSFVSPDIPDVLIGDPNRLQQVIVNLLNNAMKFTKTGEVTADAIIKETFENELSVQVRVYDTGIGVDKADQQKLFEQFAQADTTITRSHGGTGLGLAISRKLARMMNGDIVLSSEGIGKGTTVTAWFNLAKCSSSTPSSPLWSEDYAPVMLLPDQLAQFRGKNAIVLSFADHATDVLAKILSHLGMNVTICKSVEEGSALLFSPESGKELNPYVLIADLFCPQTVDGRFCVWEEILASTEADEYQVCTPPLPKHASMPILYLMRLLREKKPRLSLLFASQGLARRLLTEIEYNQFQSVFYPMTQRHLTRALASALDKVSDDKPTKTSSEDKADAPLLAEEKPLRILLVEDNMVNQKVAFKFLKTLGYGKDLVTFALNGLIALKLLETRPFDVIFMDLHMPVMDGFEATRLLLSRWNDSFPLPSIIALTADAMSGDQERCLDMGMHQYLSKPVRKSDFDRVLRLCTRLDIDEGHGVGLVPEDRK